MALIQLNQFALSPEKNGNGIMPCDLSIENGDIIQLRTDSVNDAHLMFKGLATLSYPIAGRYLFEGHNQDYSDYRSLLNAKKQIGYLTSGTALISNRSIRENLCLGQVYFDNDLSNNLDDETLEVCRSFGIENILDERPTNLGVADIRRAMLIRELVKKPQLMLMEFPRAFSGNRYKPMMMDKILSNVGEGMALVYFSFDADIVHAFQGKCLEIKKGHVTLEP